MFVVNSTFIKNFLVEFLRCLFACPKTSKLILCPCYFFSQLHLLPKLFLALRKKKPYLQEVTGWKVLSYYFLRFAFSDCRFPNVLQSAFIKNKSPAGLRTKVVFIYIHSIKRYLEAPFIIIFLEIASF